MECEAEARERKIVRNRENEQRAAAWIECTEAYPIERLSVNLNKRRVLPFTSSATASERKEKENSFELCVIRLRKLKLCVWAHMAAKRADRANTWSNERWTRVGAQVFEQMTLTFRIEKVFHFAGYKMTNCVTFHVQKKLMPFAYSLFRFVSSGSFASLSD